MNRTHSALWGFGLAGMVAGLILAAIGTFGASDVAGMAGGYGMLVIGSAAYLLIGLKIRERLGHRTPAAASAGISARS